MKRSKAIVESIIDEEAVLVKKHYVRSYTKNNGTVIVSGHWRVCPNTSWNKGLTKETDTIVLNMSLKRRGHLGYGKGLRRSPEVRQKISTALSGRTLTEEHKKHVSEANKGRLPWNTGKHTSEEIKKKISSKLIGIPNLARKGKKIEDIVGIERGRELRELARIHILNQKIPYEYTDIECSIENILSKNNIDYVHSFILGNKFRCDFAVPSSKLIIECDGDYWHNLPNMKIRDKAKDAYAKKCGWYVLRLAEHEINDNIQNCESEILNLIKARYIEGVV